MPPAPPSEVEVSAAEMNRLSLEGAEHNDGASPSGAKSAEDSDSDKESDYEAADKEDDGEKGEEVVRFLASILSVVAQVSSLFFMFAGVPERR